MIAQKDVPSAFLHGLDPIRTFRHPEPRQLPTAPHFLVGGALASFVRWVGAFANLFDKPVALFLGQLATAAFRDLAVKGVAENALHVQPAAFAKPIGFDVFVAHDLGADETDTRLGPS
jgi:hypothetical protein